MTFSPFISIKLQLQSKHFAKKRQESVCELLEQNNNKNKIKCLTLNPSFASYNVKISTVYNGILISS